MSTPERAEQQIGNVLPDVTLSLVTAPERTWSLHQSAAGRRGAVLVFWSGVCSHCERYDGYFNDFAGRHPEIAFAAVASRQNETPDDVRSVQQKRGLGFTTLYDPGSEVAHLLFTQHTPRVFLVDHESRLVYRGAIDNFKYPEDPEYDAYLEPAIASLLAGRPVEKPDTPSFGCSIESIYYTIHRPLSTKLLTLKKI